MLSELCVRRRHDVDDRILLPYSPCPIAWYQVVHFLIYTNRPRLPNSGRNQKMMLSSFQFHIISRSFSYALWYAFFHKEYNSERGVAEPHHTSLWDTNPIMYPGLSELSRIPPGRIQHSRELIHDAVRSASSDHGTYIFRRLTVARVDTDT